MKPLSAGGFILQKSLPLLRGLCNPAFLLAGKTNYQPFLNASLRFLTV
jgi:hypothetical protein